MEAVKRLPFSLRSSEQQNLLPLLVVFSFSFFFLSKITILDGRERAWNIDRVYISGAEDADANYRANRVFPTIYAGGERIGALNRVATFTTPSPLSRGNEIGRREFSR